MESNLKQSQKRVQITAFEYNLKYRDRSKYIKKVIYRFFQKR